MKTRIKEVQDYFRNKLRNGEFDIIRRDPSFLVLIIDKKYKFTLWTSHGMKYLMLWKLQFNFIYFYLSEDDQQVIWQHLEVDKNKNETIKKQIEKLKKQLI